MISDGFLNFSDIIDAVKEAANFQGFIVSRADILEWLMFDVDDILHCHIPNPRLYVYSYTDKRQILKIAHEKKYKF